MGDAALAALNTGAVTALLAFAVAQPAIGLQQRMTSGVFMLTLLCFFRPPVVPGMQRSDGKPTCHFAFHFLNGTTPRAPSPAPRSLAYPGSIPRAFADAARRQRATHGPGARVFRMPRRMPSA